MHKLGVYPEVGHSLCALSLYRAASLCVTRGGEVLVGDVVLVTPADLGSRAVPVPPRWCHPQLRAALPGGSLGSNKLISASLLDLG